MPRKEALFIDFKNPDGKITAFADRQALKQVVINLLSNAVKFSFADGHVEVAISTIADADMVELRVSRSRLRDVARASAKIGAAIHTGDPCLYQK